MIEESLAKVSRRDSIESGAEQADNWIHVTPRAKAKGNINTNNTSSSKNQNFKGKDSVLGKAPAVIIPPHGDNVVSSITSSLAAISIAAGKKKILDYVGCEFSNHNKETNDFQPIITVKPSNDEQNINMLSPFIEANPHPISSLLPADPFGCSNPLLLLHEDFTISNSFSALGGGVGLVLTTPTANHKVPRGNEDLLEMGEEFLVDLENSFHSFTSEGKLIVAAQTGVITCFLSPI